MALLDLHLSAFPPEPVLALRCNPQFAQRVSHPSRRRDPAHPAAGGLCLGSLSFLAAPRAVLFPSSEGQSSVLEPAIARASSLPWVPCPGMSPLASPRHDSLHPDMLRQPQAPHFGSSQGPTASQGQSLGSPRSCLLKLPPPRHCGWFLACWVCTCKQSPVKTSAPQFSKGNSRLALFFVLQARGAFQHKPKAGLLSALPAEVRDCTICSREAALPLLLDQMRAGAVGGQPISNRVNQSEGKRQNPQISK